MDLGAPVKGAILSSGFSDQLVIDRQWFDGFEGSLVRTNGMRKWTMLLNSRVKKARRLRFTFAHELGHFTCHRELRDKFEDGEESPEESLNDFRDEIETEANVFASWLLMPANLLRNEFQGAARETETLRAIGNRFECSLQASALRYVELCSKQVAFVVSRDGMIVRAAKSKSAPFMSSYCFGDEPPDGSHALASYQGGDGNTERRAVDAVRNDTRHAFESQYLDSSGQGYQYTCIEFQ